MSRWRRIRNAEGAAAVEFALSATITLGMLIGCFQMFMMLYSYHYVSYAARDASRWTIVRGYYCSTYAQTSMPGCPAAQSDIQTHVQGLSFPGITSSNVTVTASWYTTSYNPTSWSLCATGTPTGNCNEPGNLVKVKVNYAYQLNIPFFPSQAINMSSTSQLVISE